MNAVVVFCENCHQSWMVHVEQSLYLAWDLESRPCPHCEAYTLKCSAAAAERAPRHAPFTRPRFGPSALEPGT